MRLASDGADALEISIVGYQFPDAEDRRQRYSWHRVEGRAHTTDESWKFRYPALTCEESPRLAAWFRAVAGIASDDRPTRDTARRRIGFTEPNLALDVEAFQGGDASIRVELDLEFRAPGVRADHGAGNPSLLRVSLSPERLRAAAAAWDADVARYPDGLGAPS